MITRRNKRDKKHKSTHNKHKKGEDAGKI